MKDSPHIEKLKSEFGSDFDLFKDDAMFQNVVSGLEIGMSPYTAIAYILRQYKDLLRLQIETREKLEKLEMAKRLLPPNLLQL